jgi:predicted ABC-type ATPase
MTTAKKPRLIVIAGPDGSGKTSITEAMMRQQWMQDCEYVNIENIARNHFGDWNSPDALSQASEWVKKHLDNCLEDERDLVVESELSSNDNVEFVLRAMQLGYFVRLFFVATHSPSVNAARIAQRVMEGGHEAPISQIIARYSKSISNAVILARAVDRAYVYDNSVDNTPPTLCFRASEGRITKRNAMSAAWSDPIQDAVKALQVSATK